MTTEEQVNYLDLTFDNYRATVQQDGCVHIERNYEGLPYNSDYIHVCDLTQFIKWLQEIELAAKQQFGQDWP